MGEILLSCSVRNLEVLKLDIRRHEVRSRSHEIRRIEVLKLEVRSQKVRSK